MTKQDPTESSNNLSSHLKWTSALGIASIFAIGGLIYGVFVTSLGFYWDDWPVVWVYNAFGSPGVAAYFAGQRPAYGWVIAHVAQMLGIAPVGWKPNSKFCDRVLSFPSGDLQSRASSTAKNLRP